MEYFKIELLAVLIVASGLGSAYNANPKPSNVVDLYRQVIQEDGLPDIHREEVLNTEGTYTVSWDVYLRNNLIVFDITAKTVGFVGFGLSPTGGMANADIVIGGLFNGVAYFSDRHGTGRSEPVVDPVQDWFLLQEWENSTHTFLRVVRRLDTCDPNRHDNAIGNGTTSFIWSFGLTDSVSYHGGNRGSFSVNVLDPPMPPVDTSEFLKWKMTVNMTMPHNKDTIYWCTMHKSPPMPSKHHIVGYRPVIDSPDSLRHSHHFIVHECRAPDGQTGEEAFESYIGRPGGECYSAPQSVVPRDLCRTYLFVWAVGGKPVFYPTHVGFPVNEVERNYYLLEVHYDNPALVPGLHFETGLEFYYTNRLRNYDAGTLTIGHETSWTITVPPTSNNFLINGHCSPQCTSTIPRDGISVFNVLLHSHLSGRKLKVRHFRAGKELPWLQNDDNYDFNYQQNRPALKEIKILPGDHLTYECTYDNTWDHTNSSVVGGLSTEEEMCNGFLWHYPAGALDVCASEYPKASMRTFFGIQSMTGGQFDPLVTAPPHMQGMRYSQVVTDHPWTPALRQAFQTELTNANHTLVCRFRYPPTVTTGQTSPKDDILVTYPEFDEEYAPPDTCA